MINKTISDKVVTIGCHYRPPRGGIAQVLSNYDRYVFETFKFIRNSKHSNIFYNLLIALGAIIKLIWKSVADRDIKVVHIHTASYQSFRRSAVFVSLARLLGKKVVLHIHGGGFRDFYKTSPKSIASTLRKADMVIVLSQSWAKFFVEEVGLTNVEVLGNLIPTPTPVSTQPHDGLKLLFLGLLTPEKGIYDLLDVMRTICVEEGKDVHLHIGGNGDEAKLKAAIETLGLSQFVHYHGWVGEEQKAQLFSECDAYILPSYIEGLPMSILEAMSYAKPVIATNVGAIPEVVENDINGIIIEPGNKDQIAKAILSYVNHPEQIASHGGNAQAKSVGFLPETVSEKLECIYSNLLNS